MKRIILFVIQNRFYIVNATIIVSLLFLNQILELHRKYAKFGEIYELIRFHRNDLRYLEVINASRELLKQYKRVPVETIYTESKKLFRLKDLQIANLRDLTISNNSVVLSNMRSRYEFLGFNASSLSILDHIPYIELDLNNQFLSNRWINPFFRPLRTLYLNNNNNNNNTSNQTNNETNPLTVVSENSLINAELLEQVGLVTRQVQRLDFKALEELSQLQRQRHNLEVSQVASIVPNATEDSINRMLENSKETLVDDVFRSKSLVKVGFSFFKKILYAPAREGYEARGIRSSDREVIEDTKNPAMIRRTLGLQMNRTLEEYHEKQKENERRAKMVNWDDDNDDESTFLNLDHNKNIDIKRQSFQATNQSIENKSKLANQKIGEIPEFRGPNRFKAEEEYVKQIEKTTGADKLRSQAQKEKNELERRNLEQVKKLREQELNYEYKGDN